MALIQTANENLRLDPSHVVMIDIKRNEAHLTNGARVKLTVAQITELIKQKTGGNINGNA